jgi:hypothetical protein
VSVSSVSSVDRPLLSFAGAAQLLGCQVWLVDVLVRSRLLYSHRVEGTPRIRRRELDAFVRSNAPAVWG